MYVYTYLVFMPGAGQLQHAWFLKMICVNVCMCPCLCVYACVCMMCVCLPLRLLMTSGMM